MIIVGIAVDMVHAQWHFQFLHAPARIPRADFQRVKAVGQRKGIDLAGKSTPVRVGKRGIQHFQLRPV